MGLKKDFGNIKTILNSANSTLSVNTSEGIVYITVLSDVFTFELDSLKERITKKELQDIYDYCYNNKYQCTSVVIGKIKNVPRSFIKYLKDNYG